MNKIYSLLILFSFILFSCKYKELKNNKLVQKIENLDMIIYSNEGDKIYSISSPESTYDKDNNLFILKNTDISLFKDKEKKYSVKSNSSKLSNNNKILELIGDVQLRTVLKDNDILKADKLYWNIEDSKYLLIGNVSFENNNIILSSNKAALNSQNIIEFYNPVKYIIKNNNDKNNFEINSENAFYDIETKSVSFNAKDKRVRTKIYF